MLEKIKELLGEELAGQVEAALKGKGKDGRDIDLVIGNVPYAKASVYDRKYPNYNLHNYFIARALDALRPGGLAVLLTSASTLDSISLAARENFCSRAALLAAFRLPNTAFRQSAGTEIVADILVLQKNAVPCAPFLDLRDVPTGDDTGTMQINEYFTRHPDHILGQLSNTGKMYGKLNTPTVQPFHAQDLGELLKSHLFEIEAQDVDAFSRSDSAELCTDQVPAPAEYILPPLPQGRQTICAC